MTIRIIRVNFFYNFYLKFATLIIVKILNDFKHRPIVDHMRHFLALAIASLRLCKRKVVNFKAKKLAFHNITHYIESTVYASISLTPSFLVLLLT
jgi:hypothetical protein